MPYKDKQKERDSKRQWYLANKVRFTNKVRLRRERNRQWLDELKLTLSCEVCGERHPACLDFHHRDEALKVANIVDACHAGWRVEKLEQEIAKCAVLCANCHRKYHGSRWFNCTKTVVVDWCI